LTTVLCENLPTREARIETCLSNKFVIVLFIKEAERREEEERIRMENILSGNPLLKEKYSDTAKSDMRIKRRWDDDVVFKNCSRAEPDQKEATFINDSLRNEFHKRFMDKYIK
jgi:protein CWC15